MDERTRTARSAQRRRILELVARIPKQSLFFSEHWRSQQEGDGFEVVRVREYVSGDDPQDLELEDLVRGERNVVVRKALKAETFMVVRDMSPSSMTFHPDAPMTSKILIGDIATAILISSAYHTTTPVGAIWFSDRVTRIFPPQVDEYAYYILDQFLAYAPEAETTVDLACTLSTMRAFSDAIIYVVSDFKDPKFRDGGELWHASVSGLDIVPIVIRDPLERVKFNGRAHILIRDPGSGVETPMQLTKEKWREIREESARYYERLYARFGELRMPYVSLDTPDVDDCHKRLQEFFTRRALGGI